MNSQSTPRRAPPDYTQQSVKFRLFIGVAVVIFVLAIVERAFDPHTRSWFRSLNQPTVSEKLDNRINGTGHRTALDPPGTIVASADSRSVAEPSKPGVPIDPVQRAWQQGWKDVVSRLPASDQSLLFELLHLALRHEQLASEKTAAAEALMERINQLWADYQAIAFQSLADLKADDQAIWIDVLRQVNERFTTEVQPALKAADDDNGNLTEDQTKVLFDLQRSLVSIAQSQIEDDTPVFRPAEREIWFHQLARVQESANPQTLKPPAPRVAYLQLHKQPTTYRGQWVTVAGTARLAYRVPAPPNYLGIKDYIVYWLHPAGGPDSPILIYALNTPPGFPALSSLHTNSESAGHLREDIEVAGIFFKRAAYAAQGGTYTAPMLIANVPTWHPAPAAIAARPFPFSTFQFAVMAMAALLIAVCITTVLWSRTGRRRTA